MAEFQSLSAEELAALKGGGGSTGKTIASKRYLVIDADLFESLEEAASIENIYVEHGTIVGEIVAPLEFCAGAGCNPNWSFHKQGIYWIHDACLKPTRAWWSGHWDDLVHTSEGVNLPWHVTQD